MAKQHSQVYTVAHEHLCTGPLVPATAARSPPVDAIRQARGLPTGSLVFSFWTQQALTVAIIAALALVNVRGVRWGGLLQLIVTAVKVATLLSVILLPFLVLGFTSEPQHPPRISN